jgi:hypothetical protein
MTQQELYQQLAEKTGEDIETIEAYGFALCEPNRKELKRQRRLRLWRQIRRERHLAKIAEKIVQS